MRAPSQYQKHMPPRIRIYPPLHTATCSQVVEARLEAIPHHEVQMRHRGVQFGDHE
jgi:hypothetical protein